MNRPDKSQLTNWASVLAAIILILAWICYWYWGTLEAMAQIWWRSETYAHGLVVPPITLWLIWRERHRLATFQPQATTWLVPLLAGMVFLWLLGDLTAVNALTQFTVISIMVLSIMTLVGLPLSKQLIFPLSFLFFAAPIGDFLLPHLMEWTADFTVLALRLSGIPVYREGQQFVIPSGNWSVIETCSGIRYLIASLTVGTLYAQLTYTTLKRRLIFILVSLITPIVANWLRAYLIVMLGHLSGNKLAVGIDHLIYGWVFFGIIIAIMFAIGMRWAEPTQSVQTHEQAVTSPPANTPILWLVAVLLALVISAGPVAENMLRQPKAGRTLELSLPESINSWEAGPPKITWHPRFSNPSVELHSSYLNGDNWVGLYIAYYRNQNFESKLVTSTNVLVTSESPSWQVVTSGSYPVAIAESNRNIRTSEIRTKQNSLDERYIIWQWYWINGRLTSSDFEAKWLTALSILSGSGDDSAAIIIYAPKANAAISLPSFANDSVSEIYRALAEASQQ